MNEKEKVLSLLVYELQPDQSGDRAQLVYLTQLLADWQTFHPSEAFNEQQATTEYAKHREQYRVQKLGADAERLKKRQIEEYDLLETCRKIGEASFQVYLINEQSEQLVAWDVLIKDPQTGADVGVVRELLSPAWIRPELDPRDRAQVESYRAAIKHAFDGYTITIRNMRKWVPFQDKKTHIETREYVAVLKMLWKI